MNRERRAGANLLVTAREMRAIDARAIQGLGIPSLDLMEAAGRAAADAAGGLLRRAGAGRRGDAREAGVLVLAGRGNNGGDGFVSARHLAARGIRVVTFLVGEGDRLSDDAATNLARAREAGLEVREIRGSDAPGDGVDAIREAARTSRLIIDALFGTGLTRAVDGVAARAIELANGLAREAGLAVLAIDVPSGVNADTGEVTGPAIRADRTLALGCPKLGLFLYPAREFAGRVSVADIGIPDDAALAVAREEAIARHLIDHDEARALLPVRRPDAHKGDHGHALLVAGSPGLTGAATLAATGALRAGAGLVTLAIPRGLNAIMEVKLTEAMTIPVTESAAGTHTPRALGEILEAASGKRAVAVGPGFSRHPEAAALARELLSRLDLPVVLDADGLNAFAGDLDAFRRRTAPLILTPHPGEMARLLGVETREVVRDRLGAATGAARRSGAVVVLKGAPTFIAEPSGDVWVNSTGNGGLATGGTGDVLTGVVLGLLSQGVEPAAAARLGVYLHALAGDLVARRYGTAGYLAGDVAMAVPRAIKRTGRD